MDDIHTVIDIEISVEMKILYIQQEFKYKEREEVCIK